MDKGVRHLNSMANEAGLLDSLEYQHYSAPERR